MHPPQAVQPGRPERDRAKSRESRRDPVPAETRASRTEAAPAGRTRSQPAPATVRRGPAPSQAAERLRRLQVDGRRRGGTDQPGRTAAAGANALAVAPDPAPRPRPEAPRPRHLQVVEPGALSPAQRRRRARAVLIGGIAAASFIGFALVYLHVVLAQRQFGIDHLNNQVQQEQSTYQNLRLQVAQLGSPQHIVSTAVGQLGMVQPSSVSYLAQSAAQPGGATAAPSTVAPLGGSATAVAPAGDADWPAIKSQLAGTP